MIKPIFILGKGPSAFNIPKSNKYHVATLNNAIWLHNEPEYAFFNDIEPMELMEDDDFTKVTTMVTPSYLHSQFNPRFNGINRHVHFKELSSIFPNRFDHINFYLYELHSGDNSRPEELARNNGEPTDLPSLDETPGSTGVSAANFLAKYLGYKDFIIVGCDPKGGYHPLFENRKLINNQPAFNGQSTSPQPSGYDSDLNQMIRLIEKYGGVVTHMDDLSENKRNKLGI
jgi:hypothetical protein